MVTPTGSTFDGESIDTEDIVAISIIRAGDSLLDCFTRIVPAATVGKILIQRDEETRLPVLFYSKLPPLHAKKVLVLDPMLATGGSAKAAIQVVLDNGAREEDIVFLNVVSCPEGIANLLAAYPAIRIVTGDIDAGLNEKVCMASFWTFIFCMAHLPETIVSFDHRPTSSLAWETMETDTMARSKSCRNIVTCREILWGIRGKSFERWVMLLFDYLIRWGIAK